MTTQEELMERRGAVLMYAIRHGGEIPTEGDHQMLADLFECDRTQIYRDKQWLEEIGEKLMHNDSA